MVLCFEHLLPARTSKGASGAPRLGMTFQGGGFKSHASFTGVMAGLLAAQVDLQEMLQSVEAKAGCLFFSEKIP